MKPWLKNPVLLFLGVAVVVCLAARAQLASLSAPPAPVDSIVQITAEAQGLARVLPADLPRNGTFWLIMPGGGRAPLPCPPYDLTLPVYQIADGQYLVDDTGGQVFMNTRQAATMSAAAALDSQASALADFIANLQDIQLSRDMAASLGMDLPFLGGGEGSGSYTNNYGSYQIDTNLLWLEITNVSGGSSYLNLHSGTNQFSTNQVFAIWTTTNLLTAWQVERELWPTNAEVMPFTLPTSNREDLFVRAEDWTGKDSNNDNVPDWWAWKYFGDVNQSATNDFDGNGDNNGQEYTNHTDPNKILFSLKFTNDYVNAGPVTGTIAISGGVPNYIAVLINDTNTATATWDSYISSNIVMNLNSGDGIYTVLVGLRGLPSNAQQTWRQARVTLNTTPLTLTITNPAGSTVSTPLVQVQGYASGDLTDLTFDVSNAVAVITNQSGYVAGKFLDTNLMKFTLNYFQCYDAALTNGLNTITVHATDVFGQVATTNFNVTLVYSNDKTPPVLSVVWPQNGTLISGNSFTFQGLLDDVTATVTAQIVDANDITNAAQGVVERDGKVSISNLPMSAGANFLTVTATDAAGNPITANLTLTQSSVTVTLNPIPSSQANQSSVNVTGTISDPSGAISIWVNGKQAYYLDEVGNWKADGVPVSSTGMATFGVELYSDGTVNVGSELFNQVPPPLITLAGYIQDSSITGIYGYQKQSVQWAYANGGMWDTDSYYDGPGGVDPPIPPDGPNYAAPVVTSDYGKTFSPTWQNAQTTFDIDGETYKSSIQTTLMIVPSGPKLPTVTKTYNVRVCAMRFSNPYIFDHGDHGFWNVLLTPNNLGNFPLPPGQLTINGQSLVSSGITNDDGSIWGETIMQASAGVNVYVTPTATQVYQNHDFTFNMQASEINLQLGVDGNRDGNLELAAPDQTTAAKPFRFWINDSKESGDIVSGSEDQIPGASVPNSSWNHVQGRSDYVNFFPVALNLTDILEQCPFTNSYEYRLTQADGALKFLYTQLTRGRAFEYLTNLAGSDDYGAIANYDPSSGPDSSGAITYTTLETADLVRVTAIGAKVNTNWLAMVQTNGGVGVVLIEGYAATTKPLMLEIWRNGQKLGGVPLYMSISGVEQMFRHLNLRDGADAPSSLPGPAYAGDAGVASRMGNPSNFPDDLLDDKWLIFAHGYNVSAQASRGWEAEMFKRFYWSDSKAKFIGVDWLGNPVGANFLSYYSAEYGIADYYLAGMNAFATAPVLATKLNALSGSKTIVGHSMGCELTAFALNDFGLQVNHACLIDAAIAQECFDGNADDNLTAMRPASWENYPEELWATHWHERFDVSDARSTLTWRNRFVGALTNADVYSFYSSTEDVLGEYDGDPTSAIIEDGFAALGSFSTSPLGNYAWVVQEKTKGNIAGVAGVTIQGSDYGGWGFNPCDGYLTNYPVWYKLTGGGLREMKTPTDIGTVTSNLLYGSKYNPLFKNGWGVFNGNNPSEIYVNADASLFTGPSWILGLYQPNQGSTVASDSAKNAQLLAQAIPALSLPVGANLCTKILSVKQFDMPTQFADSAHWPSGRGVNSQNVSNWHHSDVGQVDFPYVYKLFNQVVSISNQ